LITNEEETKLLFLRPEFELTLHDLKAPGINYIKIGGEIVPLIRLSDDIVVIKENKRNIRLTVKAINKLQHQK